MVSPTDWIIDRPHALRVFNFPDVLGIAEMLLDLVGKL